MSCRFHVFANSSTSARTADSSSATSAGGVVVIAESRAVHPDRAITASTAKTVRFMSNSPAAARHDGPAEMSEDIRRAGDRPPDRVDLGTPAPLHGLT